MANKIKLRIITPKGIFFNSNVEIITIKTNYGGYIGLQYGRSPFTASLDIAPMTIGHINSENKKEAAIAGGIVVAKKDLIEIITNDIIFKENINLEKAEYDKKEAENKLKNEKDCKEAYKIEFQLKRAINKINTKKRI